MQAIVLSSHTVGLGVIRALGRMGVPIVVIYYDKKDMGYVSKYVKEKIYAPHPEKSEKLFLHLLLKYAEKSGGGLLIPADDATLTVVSKHKSLLDRNYIVACTKWEITKNYIDKKHTYTLADEIGVPAPKTIVPQSVEDVKVYANSGNYPCLVKPCKSHLYYELFGKKMEIAQNLGQLVSQYQKASAAGIEVMLQEYIPGDDTHCVNYNSYFINNKPYVEFTAEKVRYSPPGIGVPRVVISKYIPEIIESGRKILQALQFHGYSCTEFKRDPRDGVYKLMEINGRYNRSVLLAVRCGINFPWIEYKHLVHGDMTSLYKHQNGIYWIDELRDFIHSAKYYKQERFSPNQYFRPYLKPHIFAIFAWNDIGPFVKRCTDIGKMAYKSLKSFSESTRSKYEKEN